VERTRRVSAQHHWSGEGASLDGSKGKLCSPHEWTTLKVVAAPLNRLVFAFGPRRGVTLDVLRPLTVGRAVTCDVHLLDEKVSREHCVFEPSAGGLRVRDLGSRNGTWVNGTRIDGAVDLEPDDAVGIGETLALVSPSAEALRTREGDATLVLSAGPLGLTTSATSPTDDTLARAGRLLLEAALATDAGDAARRLARSMAEGLRCDEVVLCRVTPEGALRPIASSPVGAALSLNRALVDLALHQQRTVSVEELQLRAKHDAQTTTVVRQRAFVFCAPLPGKDGPVGVACGVRASAFDSDALALAQVLARAGAPALGLERHAEAAPTPTEVVAESDSMKKVVDQARRAAPSMATVLITGPSGSGKEAVARLIHVTSRRAKGPFVAINCGAIPAELAESELFGHEKGAFTGAQSRHQGVFERADDGTLFLDEVGELPLGLQVKLLRVFEERLVVRLGSGTPLSIDVRIIAATNRGLEAAVQQGAFREDLFYRLNVVRLSLAPLAERPEDVLPLARRFLARHAPSLGRLPPGLSAEVEGVLRRYPWPGNARQLSNALERALVLKADDGPLVPEDLPPEILVSAGPAGRTGATLAEWVATLERVEILRAMKRSRGVKAQAAEALGISRPTLDRKLSEYAIDWVTEPEPGPR
jgi:transcriptional regulator with PAS, ATPase and Fis domain/pSer/pThr/pTyr-binding forkhead associated (FHA) protein